MIRELSATFIVTFVFIVMIMVMVFVAFGSLLLLITLPIWWGILAFITGVAVFSVFWVGLTYFHRFKDWIDGHILDSRRG